MMNLYATLILSFINILHLKTFHYMQHFWWESKMVNGIVYDMSLYY